MGDAQPQIYRSSNHNKLLQFAYLITFIFVPNVSVGYHRINAYVNNTIIELFAHAFKDGFYI